MSCEEELERMKAEAARYRALLSRPAIEYAEELAAAERKEGS
jgi:hypothetical protein